MAIIKTGSVVENSTSGFHAYGYDGIGGLTVNGGHVLHINGHLVSDPAGNTVFFVGFTPEDDGEGYGNGTAEISGAGSAVLLTTNWSAQGAGAFIGHDSIGVLTISAGGRLEIVDSASGETNGPEKLVVGTNDGTGTLDVNAGQVLVSGSGARAHFGDRFSNDFSGGTATVTFANNSLLRVESTSSSAVGSAEAHLSFGLNGGTANVTFDASSLELHGNAATEGTYFWFGRDGGEATVTFQNGASFVASRDVTPITPSPAWVGGDVGRGGGAEGTLIVDDSSFVVSAPGFVEAYLNIGRQNANGTGEIRNGSTLLIDGENAFLNVGRQGGGVGSLVVENSLVDLVGRSQYSRLGVGIEGGVGTLDVDGGGAVFLSAAAAVDLWFGNVGNATVNFSNSSTLSVESTSIYSHFVGFYIGVNGGTADVVFDNSSADVRGNDFAEAFFQFGRDGGTADIAFRNGSSFNISNGDPWVPAATFVGGNVGRGAGGEAVLTVDASHFNILGSPYVDAYMHVGREGGDGSVEIANESSLSIIGSNATLVVGREAGSEGVLLVDDSTVLLAANGSGAANLTVGRVYGNGSATFRNDANVSMTGASAVVWVGTSGATGSLDLFGGSELTISTTGSLPDATGVVIGSYGGTGIVTVNDSLLSITADSNVGIVVGSGVSDEDGAAAAGTGTLVVENGGRIEMAGTGGEDADGGSLLVGRNAGSDATVFVRSGGVIDLDVTGGLQGYLKVGGFAAGATGILHVDGAGSSVHGFTHASIGRNPYDSSETGSSQGSVYLTNGGSIGNVFAVTVIGDGGTLYGYNGSVVGDVVLAGSWMYGGSIDMVDGLFGTLSITESLFVESPSINFLRLDVGAAGNDKVAIGGSAWVEGILDVWLFDVGGYSFVQDEVRQLITVAGAVEVDGDINVNVVGQHSGFSFYAGEFADAPNVLSILALNSGATGGTAILDFGTSATVGGEFYYYGSNQMADLWGGRFGEGGVTTRVDVVYGTDSDDILEVVDGDAGISLYGRDGDDRLQGGAGDDLLDGGAGHDIAVYSGNYSDYSITFRAPGALLPAGYTISDLRGGSPDGTDILIDIEVVRFADLDYTLPPPVSNTPPVVSVSDQSLSINVWQAFPSWLNVSDADNDAMVRYEFRDDGLGSTSGRFWVDGLGYQDAGTEFTVEAAHLGRVWIRSGSAAGSETMAVRAFDGTDWSAWDTFTLTSVKPNTAPVVSVSDQSLNINVWQAFPSWLNVSDADNDTMVRYEFRDDGLGSTSGRFWVDGLGYQDAGTEFTVEAAHLGRVWIRSGSAAGSETMAVRAFDGTDWSAWDTFTLTSVKPNTAPVVSVSDQSLNINVWQAFPSWLNVSDADNDTMVRYEFRDEGLGSTSGRFWVDGLGYQDAGTEFTVEAAHLGRVWIRSGSAAGSETMAVRAFDGTDWSAWDTFTLTSVKPNTAPVVSVSDQSLNINVWQAFPSWLNVSDADNDTMVRYEFRDEGLGSTSGRFWVDGLGYQDAGTEFTVEAAHLGRVWIRSGSAAGSETMAVRAFDGTDWSAWDTFTLTSVKPNTAPVVSVSDQSLNINVWQAFPSWLNVSDADNDTMVRYEFRDDGLGSTSGRFWVDGLGYQDAGTEFTVEAAHLGRVWIRSGSAAGSETMAVRAFDGTDWSAWDTFTLTSVKPNTAPVVSVSDQSLNINVWQAFPSWLNVSDADNDTMVRYEFRDDGLGSTSGRFWVDGLGYQDAGTEFTVEAAHLGRVWIRSGSAAGSETMAVRAFDGTDWSAWDTFTLTSVKPNTAPVVSVSDQSLNINVWQAFPSWLNVSDADNDTMVRYEFRDEGLGSTSGRFWVDGLGYQDAGTEFTVEAAHLGRVWIRSGSAAGSETMAVRAFDGTDWSAWDTFTLTSEVLV